MSIALGKFKSSFNELKDQVENVRLEELAILWFDDFYDGMLSGVVEYKNQTCRFEIITDYEQAIRPRVFAIIELSQKQVSDEIYWHGLFLQHVIADPQAKDGSHLRPQSEHHLFYEPYGNRPDLHYELSNVVAWFIEK